MNKPDNLNPQQECKNSGRVEVKSFYQLVSINFRGISGRKDYTNVMFLETDKYLVVIEKPENIVRMLLKESEMFAAYIGAQQRKMAIEWMGNIITAYMQNPKGFMYPAVGNFLKQKARKLPVSARYTLSNTGRLESMYPPKK